MSGGFYQVAIDAHGGATRLNQILVDISNRLDAIEGVRGTPSIQADLTMNKNKISDVTTLRVVDSDGHLIHGFGDLL